MKRTLKRALKRWLKSRSHTDWVALQRLAA